MLIVDKSRVNIFMPISIFIDFLSSSKFGVIKIMIVVKNVELANMLQCVDEGWDAREDNGVFCRV